MRDDMKQRLESPGTRQALQGVMRALLPTRYPDLGKALNLSQAETDKLYDLLAKQQMNSTNQVIGMMGGAGPNRGGAQDLQRQNQQQQQTDNAEISALLGTKYPAWQDYQSSLGSRQQVTQLQAALGANNALSDSQTQPLIHALATEQARIDQEARIAPTTPGRTPQDTMQAQLDRTTENNQRLVNTAASYMNAQQLDSYKQMLDRQNNLARRFMGGAAGMRGNAAGQGLPAR
jgi:hypothetical protein